MKLLTSICFFYWFSIAFTLQPFTKFTNVGDQNENSLLGDCSQAQQNAVYSAIAYCDSSSSSDTNEILSCINQKLLSSLQGQKWNIFLSKSARTRAAAVYWRFSNCYINLYSVGKYQYTYYIWPFQTYLNQTNGQTAENHLQSNILRAKSINKKNVLSVNQISNEANAKCPAWKRDQVKAIVNGCDMADSYKSANCIMKAIKKQLGQYWNVVVSTDLTDNSAYWYIDCTQTFFYPGNYQRSIQIWTAH